MKPVNHSGHKACSENSSRYKHVEDDDTKYNTVTRLIDHQIDRHQTLDRSASTAFRTSAENKIVEETKSVEMVGPSAVESFSHRSESVSVLVHPTSAMPG